MAARRIGWDIRGGGESDVRGRLHIGTLNFSLIEGGKGTSSSADSCNRFREMHFSIFPLNLQIHRCSVGHRSRAHPCAVSTSGSQGAATNWAIQVGTPLHSY